MTRKVKMTTPWSILDEMTPTEPREDMVDGEQKYTYEPHEPDDDPWADVEPEVRREQDNGRDFLERYDY